MRLPALTELETSRSMIDVFGGYNHNLRINDGEFYDMDSLSADCYPVLSTRKKHGVLKNQPTSIPVGLIEKDALCYCQVEGEMELVVYINGSRHSLGLTNIAPSEERTLVSMGAYLVVFPDNMYINTNDTDEHGSIDADFTFDASSNAVTFEICRADGTIYEVDWISDDAPSASELEKDDIVDDKIRDGFVWLDTTTSSLKIYSASSGYWAPVATTYIRISATDIGTYFEQWDGVKISGITDAALADLNASMVLYAKEEKEDKADKTSDWIVVVGIMDSPKKTQSEGKITLERHAPKMDFVVESNNRLWGCCYGENNEKEIVNEIYACKLGDFKNWNCFMGISTDSYAVSLGTDGQFTGAYSYLGMPVFFKENCIHTVYGNYPSNYQVQDTACRGVQKYSDKSLAMVNEVLYYKSRNGICAYDGSLPKEISSVLGDISYGEAVGCCHRNKYYVSMRQKDTGEFSTFSYDTVSGLWHREAGLEVKHFCSVDDELYFIDAGGVLRTMFGSGVADPDPVRWSCETGVIGCSSPDKKYINRISVRLSVEHDTVVKFYVEYDSSGNWVPVYTHIGNRLQTFTIPIRPRRCDHFRMRIVGVGDAKIYSICKSTEQGSDI